MALLTLTESLGLLALASFAYATAIAIYRLYLHPLSRFPGPKLAALTGWYEVYFDLILDGQFLWEIERLHAKHGPIIRINPTELHVKDSSFFGSIYAGTAGGRKTDKDAAWAMMAGAPQSGFSTPQHDVHKMRRGALNPFFSKRMVGKLEPRVSSKVERLCERFRGLAGSGTVVPLHVAASAFTMDVISEYCYGAEGCTHYLDDEEFKPEWAQSMQNVFDGSAFRRAVPWLTASLQKLPVEYVLKLMPSMEVLLTWQADLKTQVERVLRDYQAKGAEEGKEKRETIFHSLLENEELPQSEKTLHRLADEAEILVAAGSETTARTIAYASFYVLSTEGVLDKLRQELRRVMPDKSVLPTWTELEKLPYLTGIIQEGLRLTFGVTTRSPRVSHEALQYGEWTIPARTPIASTTYFVSTDPTLFPDPFAFRPERWLKSEDGQRLDTYLTNFSKGTRNCLGQNLAYSELYLVLAALFRRFELELFETTVEDVRVVRDKFVGMAGKGSRGVRIVIKGEVAD